eukprot:g6283.t1
MFRMIDFKKKKKGLRAGCCSSWRGGAGAFAFAAMKVLAGYNIAGFEPLGAGEDDGAEVDGNDGDGDDEQDSNNHSYNTLGEQGDDDEERDRVDSAAAFLSEEVRAETLKRRVDTMVLAREPHAVRDIQAFFEGKKVEAEIAEVERKFSHAGFLEEAQGQEHQRDVPMISSSLVESDRSNVHNFEAEVEFNVATGIFTDLKDMMLGVPPKLLDPMQNPLIDPNKALGEAAPVAAKARLKELVLRAQKTWASTSTALALSTDLWAPPQRVVRQIWLRGGAGEPKGGRASYFTPVRGAVMRAGKGGKGGQIMPSYSFDPSKDPSGNPINPGLRTTYTAALPVSTWKYGGAKTSTRNAGEHMLPQELVHAEYTLYSSTRSLREKGQPVKEDDMRTIAFGMSCDGAIFADKFALVSSDPPDHERLDSSGYPVWARPSSTTASSTRAAVEAAMAKLIAGDKDTAEVGEETATGSTRTGGPGSGAASGSPPLYQERFSPFTDVEVYPVNPRVFLNELNFEAVAKSQNKEKRFSVFHAEQDAEEGGDTPDMLRKAYEAVLGSYNDDSEDELESTSRPGGSNGLRAVMNQAFKSVVGLNKPFQSFIKRAWTASDHMPFVSTAKIVLPAAVLEGQTLLPPTATAYVVADPEGSSTADVHFLAARTAAEQANKTRCQDQLRIGAALSAGVPGSASPQLMTEQLSCGSSGAQAHWLQNFNPFSKATTGADEGARTDVGDRQDHYAKARRAAGAVGDDEGAEADDGYLLKSYEKVEFLEGYWTRLLRGAGFQLAADPGLSYHEGLPARARQFLREHDVTDRAGQQARRIYAGSPAWKSELLDGEEVLMGNSVYVSPGGWNGELEEYPHGFGTEVPRRAVGFGTVLCPVLSPAAVEMSAGGGELVWVPIATLGSGHQSGGKFDDALLLDAVLHGGFDHASGEKPQPQVVRGAQVDVDKASPTSCTGRDASDDMDCVEVDHAPSAGPADEEDSEAVPMVQSDSLGQQKHGTWARRASKRLKTADRVGVSDSGHLMLPLIKTEDDSDLYGAGGADLDDAVLSPVRSRNEMHFRGAGTLGRAQVRAFLAEMLEAHAAPAIALFMDFNAKPDMPLLQKVLPQIFPEQYKHELAVLEFDGDDYGNDPRYDDEVHNVFLDQMGDNFVVLSKEASSGALQPPAAPPAK